MIPIENEKEILAKLQGLEEQVDILTRLVIALSYSSLHGEPRVRKLVLNDQIEEIVSEKGKLANLMRILNVLNSF